MADDSKIMIDLELRKDQAEARLRQFEAEASQYLEKLQKKQAQYAKNPTAFVKNQLDAVRGAYDRRIANIQGTGRDIRNLQMRIDQESARKGGRLFGMAVNKQTEKFVKQFVGAYVAREAMNLGFAAMYTPGGNNAGVRKAQGMVEGATTGAQVGSMFGPLGTAIGTAVGALAGFSSALIKESKEIEAARAEIHNQGVTKQVETGRNIQNQAFEQSLSYLSRPAQIAKLNERINEVDRGSGQFSIKSLEERLEQFHKAGDHESNQYQYVRGLLDRALNEKAQLQQQLFSTAIKPYYQHQDVARYSDSRAKQGLYSGIEGKALMINSPLSKVQNAIERAGIDTSKLNSDQLQKWVDYAGDMQGKGKGDKGRENFEAMLKRTTGADVDLKGIDFKSQRKVPINGIDFKALNNPVVQELGKIRGTLERIAGRADINGTVQNINVAVSRGKGKTYHTEIAFQQE